MCKCFNGNKNNFIVIVKSLLKHRSIILKRYENPAIQSVGILLLFLQDLLYTYAFIDHRI